MAIYRFRISFEDYDDVTREIDIKSTQTFEDLHRAIHRSTGYNADKPSSFYVSTDNWIKGDEIAIHPTQRKIDNGVVLMEKSKLSSFIEDPHQKFYYIYNFERPYDFHVELIKIILDNDPKIEYPYLVKSIGEAPKIIEKGNIGGIAASSA
ncbi:IS1096 element passenger TnpR family protein, partial [Pedobacter sp.]